MANISSYDQLSSWNEDDDLLFVQQPDAPKKAHPSQMKEYILRGLDVSSVGGAGKYISEISEADGKINAVVGTMDDVPTENSNAPVKSGGIKTAIENSVSLKTATGNPITLTDAANANAEELSMTIEPIQDLHGYSKPWPAGGGKNIAHIDSTKIFNTNKNPSDPITGIADGMLILGAAANGYIRTATLGSYTINNTNSITVEIVNNASFGVGIVVEVDDTKTYTLNLVKTGGDVEIGWLNNDGSSLSSAGQQTLPVNLTPPTGAKYLLIVCLPGLTEHTFSNIQLEVGTSASTFEPWENICPISGLTSGELETTDGTDTNTATITFGQTVYGGEVDFKTGILTLTHGAIDMDLLTWTYHSATSSYSEFFDTVLPNDSILGDSEIAANIISPIYKTISSKWIAYQGYDNGVQALAKDSRRFITCDKRFNNAADYTNAMTGNILVYELATPTTLTLTPAELELLKGNNTITANGAEISIEYYPDNAIGVLAGRVDDVQEQIAGLDTRVTALEGGGVFEMLTNDRVNTPQTEESKTMTVTRGGAGIFNAANDDIKYLWFVFIADGSNIGVDLPGPICIPRAFFTDQKTNFTYRAPRCDVEIRRGDSDNQIIWNWTFDNAEALPSEAYRYRIYVAK